jgi:PPP family 3-phenylpropionic acid transporter
LSPVYFAYFGAVGALSPYLSLYFRSIGLTGTEIGLLMSVQPVLLFISQPIFGPLTDRSGHRGRMLSVLLLIVAATGLLMGAGRSFWSLLPLVMLWSFFAGLIGPIADSIALGEMERTGVAYPRLRLWGSIGFPIVAVTAGWLYGRIGVHSQFFLYGGLMLFSVFFARQLPAEGLTGRRPVWGELWKLVKNPYLLAFLLLCAVEQTTLAANSAFFSVHFMSVGGSSSALGWAWGLTALAEVPVWLVLGSIIDRTGPLPLLALSGAAYALRWGLNSVITNPNLLVGVTLLQSITYALLMPTAVIFVGELTPPELRTSGQALLGLVTLGLATLVGTYVGGRLVDQVGTAGMYRFSAWVALVACGGFLLLLLLRTVTRKRRAAQAHG